MSDKQELTRSEVARQRRAQRAVKELAQTSKRATKPVVVAARVAPRAAVNRKRFANQRRFNIALGLPEIHLHKPNIAAQRLYASWRLASISIAIVLGAVIYLALSLPYFRVPNATVLGNNRLTREEIESVTGVIGQSIFTVQPEDVTARLRMNYPELLSVQVNVYLPNHVYITLTERQPVILWEQDGGYTWIDATGVAFRPRGFVTGLVLVQGSVTPPIGAASLDDPFAPPPFIQKELVDAILALAPTVPADSTMVFDRSFGLGWIDSRGWKSFFGTSAQDMPLKVRVYQSLVDSLVKRGIAPSFINVMYPDAPFYRAVEEKELTLDSGQ
ncbi:MAG: FtsQ-type POTRA domain-containing protein [Anaerolineales bacterium]|nr:FtsQ-type POTRA domain-containing protein [Anaerolineales bacterium]